MTITRYEFFYDGQQRRYLEQLVRAFSGFSYQTGMRQGQPPQTVLVPCHLAQTNRMVAQIQRNLSENTMNAVPMITVYQSGLRGRRADLQNPNYVDSLQVFEREIVDNQYTSSRGRAYSVDRLMPLPFEMDVQVDLWTSNLEQKMMLVEQMLVTCYPQFEIQNSDNALDWTAVTVCFVEDEMTFSSRTVPIGTTDEIDIFTMRLRLPFWLTPPAMIRRLTRIEEVVANVGQEVTDDYTGEPTIGQLYQRVIVTPGDYSILVDGNVVTLLANKGADTLSDGSLPSWQTLFDTYGKFHEGTSQLRLILTDDIEGSFVAGTMQYGDAQNIVLWTIDAETLPANTLPAIDAVIDPLRTSPISGLSPASNGQRYLLVSDIGPSVAWGNITAYANDIIQYNGGLDRWQVAFDARSVSEVNYVLNTHTTRQLRWTGREWIMSIDNMYTPGYWRLAL